MAIGNSTESAILAGVIRGTASAIDGLISQSIEELGEKATIIVTGGQYAILSNYMKTKIEKFDSNLTLVGVKKIFNESTY